MTDRQDVQPTLLTEAEAAGRLRLSPLASHASACRVRGGGPPFVKLGRQVLYRLADLDTYVKAQQRQSTSEGS